ncbi:hypothetical protein [Bellilinea sp.]|uniref:hypothetical protein n=1 Tax=Bellilinea sp. TaxID=2838785 RepID=UPI002ADE9083|nr:hypothetical protein [Bellilinea sp.]
MSQRPLTASVQMSLACGKGEREIASGNLSRIIPEVFSLACRLSEPTCHDQLASFTDYRSS